MVKFGDQGDEVKKLQTLLKTFGYLEGKIDGIFGTLTDLAVKKVEAYLRIPKDGVVDASIWAHLNNLLDTENSAKYWFPFATKAGTIKTSWKYPKDWPEGAIIHFTVSSNASSPLETLKRDNFPCLVIDKDGTLYQPFPINEGGPHCGTKEHRTCIGIELVSAGLVTKVETKFKTAFNSFLLESDVRYVHKQDNMKEGWYEKYTRAQESTLLRVLLWLKAEEPSIFDLNKVKGHDEVAPLRKSDPGGSLSMSMLEYRSFLNKQWG